MAKYRVYFNQVNQTMYQVKAKDEDEDEAVKKARRLWRQENGEPSCAHVELDERIED